MCHANVVVKTNHIYEARAKENTHVNSISYK